MTIFRWYYWRRSISVSAYTMHGKAFPQSNKILKNISIFHYCIFQPLSAARRVAEIIRWYTKLFLFQNQLQVADFILLFPYWWGLIAAVEICPILWKLISCCLWQAYPLEEKTAVTKNISLGKNSAHPDSTDLYRSEDLSGYQPCSPDAA